MKILDLLLQEKQRQKTTLQMIASENFVSKDVLKAVGSVAINKYAEGYPNARYYNGCEIVDEIETAGIDAAKQLFNCEYANLQPHSGSSANAAVYGAILNKGDKILGMSLNSGGHLTHGFKVSFSGKIYEAHAYDVDEESFLIDFNKIEEQAMQVKPKLIIAGFSAYTRDVDWSKFREIANKVGALLLIDMAHVAGLVAKQEYSDPLPFADIVTTTNHKTLRGARGGMILSNNPDLFKKLNSSVFPGNQGGPLMNHIAGKAIALQEALTNDFKNYIVQVKKNAKTLGEEIKKHNIDILTGGTDNHMIIVDLRKNRVFGNEVADLLNKCGIICNKNSVPFDTTSPTKTAGIRLGTPAITTLGLTETHMVEIAKIVADVVNNVSNADEDFIETQKQKVAKIVADFDFRGLSLE